MSVGWFFSLITALKQRVEKVWQELVATEAATSKAINANLLEYAPVPCPTVLYWD